MGVNQFRLFFYRYIEDIDECCLVIDVFEVIEPPDIHFNNFTIIVNSVIITPMGPRGWIELVHISLTYDHQGIPPDIYLLDVSSRVNGGDNICLLWGTDIHYEHAAPVLGEDVGIFAICLYNIALVHPSNLDIGGRMRGC